MHVKTLREKIPFRDFINGILRDFTRNHAEEESRDNDEKNQQVIQTNH